MSQQCCNAVLCKKSSLRIVSCNITFRMDGRPKHVEMYAFSKALVWVHGKELTLIINLFIFRRYYKFCWLLQILYESFIDGAHTV